MSVALIAHYLGPKLGIGQYLDRLVPSLITELNSRNIACKIIASPNAVDKTLALQELIEVVDILPQLDYSPGKRYLWFITQFAAYCRQHNLKTVVWLSNPHVLPWHPPTISVLHDVNDWKVINKGWLVTKLRGLIYLDASIYFSQKIIAISQATAIDLLDFRSNVKLEQKLSIIVNGTDSSLSNLPPQSISSPNVPFLLSVGRIDPDGKRLPAAVKLTSILRKLSNQPWELHLLGGMNQSTQVKGKAFLKSIKNVPWVKYHGYVEDGALAQWYREATAMVFLSDWEGFGLPIAEAVSFNRWAIISKNNQASIEVGGEAIIVVDPDRPKQAASKVLTKLESQPYPNANQSLPTWNKAAIAYAEEIHRLMKK